MPATLKCAIDGPYLVQGLDRLTNSKGESLEVKGTVALCRCGGSASKPFCDGTHKRNAFSGARIADGGNDRDGEYRAPGVVLRDNRSICAHAGHCTEGLPAVFREEGKPWIDAGGANSAAIAAVVARCPSGALRLDATGAEPAAPPGQPRIAIEKDGPYAVTGDVAFVDAPWAQGADKHRFTLCRCGASRNKPYCDGSHWDAGFKDEKN